MHSIASSVIAVRGVRESPMSFLAEENKRSSLADIAGQIP